MGHGFNLQEYETVSNSGSLHEDGVHADVGLRIVPAPAEEGHFDFTLFGRGITSATLHQSGISRWSPVEIFGLVDECRKLWKSTVVDCQRRVEIDGKGKFEFRFQDRWDFQNEPNSLDDIVPKLARAGHDLFTSVFERNCDGGLKDIAQTLRDQVSSRDHVIAITSSKFFLPWGMLYTHPVGGERLSQDGSNWKKNGFWGYRHIVNQTPENYKLENGIRPDAGGGVTLSVNFDDRLAKQMQLPIIDNHIQFMCGLGATHNIKRTMKSELELVFTEKRSSLERILYFYCHGHGSTNSSSANLTPPHFTMTDGEVSAFDFQRWSDGQKLPTSPLVFINACQGGQMTTMFYQSFAVELLKEGAVGLLGAQIDVPAIFGAEYANQLLTGFFIRKNAAKVRLGPLLRDVNQALWDKHNNPLGLVYSLYRGVDCFIDWPNNLAGDSEA